MSGSLDGRVAIVTRAGRGRGRAFAPVLAEGGAFVAVAEVNPETGQHASHELVAAGLRARFHDGDVRSTAAIESMVADLAVRQGRIEEPVVA